MDAVSEMRRRDHRVCATTLEGALKDLRRHGGPAQVDRIVYLDKRTATQGDLLRFGTWPNGDLAGLWRYWIGSCRMVCRIKYGEGPVLVVFVGHCGCIYEQQCDWTVFLE